MLPFIRLTDQQLDVNNTTGVIKAEDYRVWLEAEAIEQQARSNAAAITADAEKHYYAEKQRGYQEGLAKAEQESCTRLMDMAATTGQFIETLEDKMTRIVFDAVSRIIDDYDDDALIRSIVQNAVRLMCNDSKIKIIVAPEQVASIKNYTEELLQRYATLEWIDVTADAAMEVGGCRVETPAGVVNAGVEKQLAALKEALESKFTRNE